MERDFTSEQSEKANDLSAHSWEITSVRELELAHIDEAVIDTGFAIIYLDESPSYRKALLSAFLNGQTMELDDGKEVTITWYEKEILLSTPLSHAYTSQFIQAQPHLHELFMGNNVHHLHFWMLNNPTEKGEAEQSGFWQSTAFLESEACVALYNLVTADYVKRYLASETVPDSVE